MFSISETVSRRRVREMGGVSETGELVRLLLRDEEFFKLRRGVSDDVGVGVLAARGARFGRRRGEAKTTCGGARGLVVRDSTDEWGVVGGVGRENALDDARRDVEGEGAVRGGGRRADGESRLFRVGVRGQTVLRRVDVRTV